MTARKIASDALVAAQTAALVDDDPESFTPLIIMTSALAAIAEGREHWSPVVFGDIRQKEKQ